MQTDGNRIYKDMRNYVSAVRGEAGFSRRSNVGLSRPHGVNCAFTDMREASRRLSQSLFDAYDPGWVGGEDLGSIVEVSKLLCPIFKSEQLQMWGKKYVNRWCGCLHSR